MRKYKNVPITFLKTGEIATALFEVCIENRREVACFTTVVPVRLDYDEMIDIQVGENEFPFKIMHIGNLTGDLPFTIEMYAKQVGTFSAGRWEKILRSILDESKC